MRPPRQSLRGFTLVELLVVIAIIGALTALLLPAVNSARKTARQGQCVNNQSQLAKAVINYASSKMKMPPYMSPLRAPQNTPAHGRVGGFLLPLLPYFDEQKTWELIQDTGALPDQLVIASVLCPEDTSTDRRQNPRSYIGNGGYLDDNSSPSGNQAPVFDHRENGVLGRSLVVNTLEAMENDQAYVASNDGAANTLMISERAFQEAPAQPTIAAILARMTWVPQPAANANDLTAIELAECMVWNINAIAQPIIVINGQQTQFTFNHLTRLSTTDPDPAVHWVGTPSSLHTGGFVAAFADGHTSFLNALMDYRVYARLLTSNGAKCRIPRAAIDPTWQAPPPSGWSAGAPVSTNEYEF